MAMPRCGEGTSLTTLPPMEISPPVIGSSPAIIRSRVDLPQPEGPTKTTNSPDLMSRSTPWTTASAPYDFLTLRSNTSDMGASSGLDQQSGDFGDAQLEGHAIILDVQELAGTLHQQVDFAHRLDRD